MYYPSLQYLQGTEAWWPWYLGDGFRPQWDGCSECFLLWPKNPSNNRFGIELPLAWSLNGRVDEGHWRPICLRNRTARSWNRVFLWYLWRRLFFEVWSPSALQCSWICCWSGKGQLGPGFWYFVRFCWCLMIIQMLNMMFGLNGIFSKWSIKKRDNGRFVWMLCRIFLL